MPTTRHPHRVAYVVSDDLVRFSNLLPSNIDRSVLVHTLAYHLDLLDIDSGNEHEDAGRLHSSAGGGESSTLLRALASRRGPALRGEAGTSGSRAMVCSPHEASSDRMTAYHETSYIMQLAKERKVRDRASAFKRRRVRSSSASDASESDSACGPQESDECGDESASFHESNLMSTAGPSRKRGVPSSGMQKNQFGLEDDCPPFDGLHRYVQLVAGASIAAAERLVSGQADIAIAWDGGRHHAKKGSASGFCYINDAVLAILALRKPTKVTVTTTATRKPPARSNLCDAGNEQEQETPTLSKKTIKRINKVLYLDLDLHWGDGVEEAFHNTPNVLTLSIHHYAPGFFPCYAPSSKPDNFGAPGSLDADAGAGGTTLNIPLGLGTCDATFERMMHNAVQPLVDAWGPEAVVVQCGVDGLSDDPMKTWNLSSEAYVRAIQRVLSWNKPTLLLGGGGYSNINAARVWALITAVCLGRYEQDATLDARVGRRMISGTTNVPDHEYWHCYNTGFTLQVKPDNSKDLNTEDHLRAIETKFQLHAQRLASKPTPRIHPPRGPPQ